MRLVWIPLYFVFALSISACSIESTESEEDSKTVVNTDTIVVAEELDAFEQQYTELLSSECECDLDVIFDISGEGDLNPIYMTVDGEELECLAWSGHVISYNPETNKFILDSLEDWSDFDEAELIEFEPGWNTMVSMKKGPVYKWPDSQSEETYTFSFDSSQELKGCYGKWAKVSFQNEDSNKKDEGWVLISKNN